MDAAAQRASYDVFATSIDESLLDLLWIALDATSSGAIYSLYQTASLTSDEVRKIERSVRLMAARNLAPCIRRNDINEDNIFYTPLTGDGKVSI